MKKKHTLIMLATDKDKEANSLIGKYVDTANLALRTSSSIPIGNGQELYILSDEKPKNGDWIIDTVNNVRRAIIHDENHLGNRKIIATTDSSLTIESDLDIHQIPTQHLPIDKQVAQIPLDFIKHFISEYDKSRVVTEVEVEYDGYTNDSDVGNYEFINKGIKINQDNTINISIVEEKLYSKTDIINALHQVELKHKKDMSIIYSQLIEFL